jgi:hypothetical protein
MRCARDTIWLIAVLFGLLGGQPAGAQEATGLSLEDLVLEVKVALLRVQDGAEANALPKLSKAVLEVNTELKAGAGGKVSLWVVEVGASTSSTLTSSMKLTLKPPEPGSVSDVAAVRIADALAAAILAGAKAIAVAGAGNPPLIADELTATIKFAIDTKGNGGLAIKFPPFGALAEAGMGTAAVQTIEVTYVRK